MAVISDVIRLTPNIVEVIVRAPIAARAFQPGQFYRLQELPESLAPRTGDTVLGMEGLALTGAYPVDHEHGYCFPPSCWRWADPPTCALC